MTKILLVEDDKSLREIYGVRLLAEGYDIVSAGDGEEALAMAIKEKPTLIISDVMMPKISGFDMLDILRSTTETRDIKVIMMTALSSDDQRARGEQLGADRYLVKSQVGIEDVVRTVHEVLDDGSGAPAGAPSASNTTTPAADSTTAPADNGTSAPADTAQGDTKPAGSDSSDASTTTSDASASSTDDAASSTESSAPGNDDAGPLPPQPTETALPQPTAPFSSPRPTNLGEQVVNPLDDSASDQSTESSEPAPSSDTPASDDTANASEDTGVPATPVSDSTDVPAFADASTPPVSQSVDLSSTPDTDEEEKPAITGTSTPIS